MSTHALFSPSGAHRWMACPGSITLEADKPDTSSGFANEGTAAHFLASECLEAQTSASVYLGRQIVVGRKVTYWLDDGMTANDRAPLFTVDPDMCGHVQTYLDNVREYALGNELMIEQRVEFSHVVDAPDQFGTSDVIILTSDGDEIQVHDLKYGRGVKVDAEENPQLMLYALGALNEYGMVGDFKRVRMVIHQPRLNHLSEWDCDIDSLLNFASDAKAAAQAVKIAKEFADNWVNGPDYSYLNPGEKQCRFCKAKATCPALTQQVLNTVADDFVDLTKPVVPQLASSIERIENSENDHLAQCLSAVDMIESWCKAVRAKVEAELISGRPVPGYKLVEGKRGNRKWDDDSEAETALKAMRLKLEEIYDFTLISPTTAEKLHKAGVIGPRQWPKVQALITQSDGKPSVAPASDKRAAIAIGSSVDDFEMIA